MKIRDQVYLFALTTTVLVGSSRPAFAYLDPATGSMILQAILGGVAGAMVVGRVYWHKIKSFFSSSSEAPEDSQSTDPDDK